jgi:flagellar basal body P-ring formation protein FlgA
MTSFRLPAGLAVLCLSAAASGAVYQDLDALDAQIAASLGGGGIPVPIDRRIRLAECPTEPVVSRLYDGAIVVRCAPLGWKIRVAVAGGAGPLEAAAEILVHRGDPVELVVKGRGFSASAQGTAIDEGGAGKPVRVKIPTSALPVSAIVIGAGLVAISG